MKSFAFVFIAVILCLFSLPSEALDYGLNNNAPINAHTGAIGLNNNPDVLAQTGAKWIRVNFILGPWSSPDDPTRRGPDNLTWFETYDQIIDGMVNRGLQVFGLIGQEAIRGFDRNDPDAYADTYAQGFATIVEHYKDRVRIFEMFNEPNDWAGGTSAQVPPSSMALYMARIYEEVKINRSNPDLILVSPPLFTHDIGGTDFSGDFGGPYFTQIWQAGLSTHGWETIRQQTGSYPFDGVGLHVYVAQDASTTDETLKRRFQDRVDSMDNSLVALEGEETEKKIYLSEFGYNSASVSEAVQAQKLTASLEYQESDDRIAQTYLFSLNDFGTHENWGIFRGGSLSLEDRKPAYDVFKEFATRNGIEEDDALLNEASIPAWFVPDGPQPILVEMQNIGSSDWPEGDLGPYRLAAGSTTTGNIFNNESLWENFANGGDSHSPLDQRACLSSPGANSGQAGFFEFDIRFPADFSPGPGRFAARMLNEDDDYFGPAIERTVLVAHRSDNLLQNGSFETGDLTGWQVVSGGVDGVQQPDWLSIDSTADGDFFLGAAAHGGVKNGIVAQQVQVVPGEDYAAVVGIRTHRVGGQPGQVACRIGLDPDGGLLAGSSSIVWSDWTESQDAWSRISTWTTALSDTLTLFLEHRHSTEVSFNVSAYDDAILAGPAPSLVIQPGHLETY